MLGIDMISGRDEMYSIDFYAYTLVATGPYQLTCSCSSSFALNTKIHYINTRILCVTHSLTFYA